MSLKNLFTNKVNIEYDLKCLLECTIDDDLNSSFILKNISGSKKIELLGSNILEIDLNLLLADNFRSIHNNFMIDILRNREKSKFWNLFINGKMNRIVNIINPITKYEYGVKLNISFNSQNENKIVFDIIFTDVSIVNKIINNTGLLTHDLRSIIKSAQNIVTIIEKEQSNDVNLEFKNKENFSTLKELLDEALQMCSKSRIKLITDNLHKTEEKIIYDIKIYLEISKYVKKIKKIFPNIEFNLTIKTNISITTIQNDCLWHLFLNIVKNAVNANCTMISILVDDNNENELMILIEDNGNGMTKSTKQNFFSRKLPDKIKNTDINSNRGEGFLLSYYEWINLGGNIEILNSEINIGTTFLIKIKGFVVEQNFKLSKLHINLIFDIKKKSKKILFLIDDSLLNLKIMSIKIIKTFDSNYKHTNFPILTPEEWQNIGIIQIEIDTHVLILMANGLFGKEVGIMLTPDIIITDIQMPELDGIQMIKSMLEYGFKSKILINSAYSDKNDNEIIELIEKNNIIFIEKGSDYSFIEKLFSTH